MHVEMIQLTLSKMSIGIRIECGIGLHETNARRKRFGQYRDRIEVLRRGGENLGGEDEIKYCRIVFEIAGKEKSAEERLLRGRVLNATAFADNRSRLFEQAVDMGKRERIITCPAIVELDTWRPGRREPPFS